MIKINEKEIQVNIISDREYEELEYNEIIDVLKNDLGNDTLKPETLYNNIKNSSGTVFSLATIFAVSEDIVIRIKNCSYVMR